MKIHNHDRYCKIQIEHDMQCCQDIDEKHLKIVIYKNSKLLRSHTVKHYLNLEESDFKQKDSVLICRQKLEKIQCPFITKKIMDNPPCGTYKSCELFNTCTTITSSIENEYIEKIKQLIEESLNIPRYACYFSRSENNNCIIMIPDQKFKLSASLLEKTIYNLTTCYNNKKYRKLKELYQSEARNIKIDSNSISWCTEENWGITNYSDQVSSKKNAKKYKKKKKFRSKGGGNNFRRFLNEIDY